MNATLATDIPFALEEGTLRRADGALLVGLAEEVGLHGEPGEDLAVLHVEVAVGAGCYAEYTLGRFVSPDRFTASRRCSPFWVTPAVGRREAELGREILWVLARRADGLLVLLLPLLDDVTRYSLRGDDAGFWLVAETGDPAVNVTAGPGLLVAIGVDPYEVFARAAAAVIALTGRGSRRVDKPVPDFVSGLGWCTWDAFYHDVTRERVEDGLRSFAAGGIAPRTLIIDDGWQTIEQMPTGEKRLVSLEPNAAFDGDLSGLVRTAKAGFGVRHVLVWHAYLGYWGGLAERSFSHFGVRSVPRNFGPGVLAIDPTWNVRPWGAQVGVPSAAGAALFYRAYHARLRAQGIDGVKVDVQGMLQAVAAGQGGRVALDREFRAALEASVEQHFQGRLINCMSVTPECVYRAERTTVMRTSDDFFPQRPETHGHHLFVNAHTSLWAGEFILPDWDMFQSGHAWGAFHAAARAISGGPVYVSDRPGVHDFALLRRLVLSDGTVLRADQPGRLTADVLFSDPTSEPCLLKIFTTCGVCGVVGLFNVRAAAGDGTAESLAGRVRPEDVPGLTHARYAGCAVNSGAVWLAVPGAGHEVRLAYGEWEVVSFAPVTRGFAAFGLADKINGSAAIIATTWLGAAVCEVTLRDGGDFVAWCEHPPTHVNVEDRCVEFVHDARRSRLEVNVKALGTIRVRVTWEPATAAHAAHAVHAA